MTADDTRFSTRAFAAGRASFVARCSTAEMRDTLEEVFADLADVRPSETSVEIVVTTAGDNMWRFDVGDEDWRVPESPDSAIAGMIAAVSRLALDADPSRLHLHSAALAFGDRGLLISAESGTGKTTLAAALLERGWTYVSDEMVAFDAHDPAARGFPKPLSVKPSGRQLLPGVDKVAVAVETDEEDPWLHVPARRISDRVAAQVHPTAIVVLHRALDGSTDAVSEPLHMHPVDAVAALMSQTMDAARFGPDAVVVLAELAARCHCVSVAVGPLDPLAKALAAVVESEPPRLTVDELEQVPGPTLNGWLIGEQVRSMRIGDRVVVHDTSGGAIAAFDEAGTMVWRALHGDQPDWWQSETSAAAGTRAFLEALESNGLVTREPAEERVGR